MLSPSTHYRHSHKISLVLFPIALAICGAIAGVAAFAYAYSIVYVPVVQLAFVLPLLYGAAMGAAVAWVFRLCKVRSPWLTAGAALVITGGSYLFSWIPWTYATFSRAEAPIEVLAVLYPPTLFAMIAEIYEVGAWTIGRSGDAVSGVMLGICWAMEAAFVLGVAPFVAYSVGATGVFCEKCERWCTKVSDVARFPVSVQHELAPRLDGQDLRVLGEVPRAQPYDNPFLMIELDQCPGCGETNTLSLIHVHRTQQNKREQVTNTMVVDHVFIGREQAEWIRRSA